MQINTFNPTPTRKLGQAKANLDGPGNQEEPKETFRRGGGEFKNSAVITGCGFIPVVGAATNLMAAWGTAWHDGDANKNSGRPAIALAGTAANLVGTVVEGYGLITGSHTAKMVGLALLGTSGVAAGTVCLMTKNR